MAGTSASSTIRRPLAADVEAHRPLGVGVEPAAAWPAPRRGPPRRRCRRRRHHGGGAVAEQPAGDQVGHRDVVALHGQRAELDARPARRVSSGWPTQVVVQPGDPGGAGDAAEPDQRHPLDVRAQPDQRRDPGVQGGHREARSRSREMTRSTSLGVRSAALSASASARAPSSTACSMNRSLAWPKSRELGVLAPAAAPGCRWLDPGVARGSGAAAARRGRRRWRSRARRRR